MGSYERKSHNNSLQVGPTWDLLGLHGLKKAMLGSEWAFKWVGVGPHMGIPGRTWAKDGHLLLWVK